MKILLNFPGIVFVLSLLVLGLSARVGSSLRRRRDLEEG